MQVKSNYSSVNLYTYDTVKYIIKMELKGAKILFGYTSALCTKNLKSFLTLEYSTIISYNSDILVHTHIT